MIQTVFILCLTILREVVVGDIRFIAPGIRSVPIIEEAPLLSIPSNLKDSRHRPDTVISFPGDPSTTNEKPLTFASAEKCIAPSPLPPEMLLNDDYVVSNCTFDKGVTIYKGKCHRLLSSLPCQNSKQWLIMVNHKTPIPCCVSKPCPEKHLPYNGDCVLASDVEVCGEGEQLFIDYFGKTHCDCSRGLIYDTTLKKCLSEHERGSCPVGNYLELNRIGSAVCVQNPCKIPHLIQHPVDKACYRKTFIGKCDSEVSDLVFNTETGFADCEFHPPRNIFEAPAVRACPPGSKRNHLNVCQAVLRVQSRSVNGYRVPAQYSSYSHRSCLHGYTKYPDGTCRSINPLFG